MNAIDDYQELLSRAFEGDTACKDRLIEQVSQRLGAFVYRLTLNDDLTKDIVQECIVEMLEVFDRLRNVERFWYWLYGMAYHKICRHFRKESRHKAVSLSDLGDLAEPTHGDETLAEVVTQELRQIVVKAMHELQPRYRAVLTLRCYDHMPYSRVAKLMGCTEFAARVLFHRAKGSLAKKLAAHGLGEGSLVLALVVFGKLTAGTKAAAAEVAVTAKTLEVGAVASVVALATGKVAILGLVGAGLLGAGVAAKVSMSAPEQAAAMSQVSTVGAPGVQAQAEYWYHYPEGLDGPVMIRVQDPGPGNASAWTVLQNASANYSTASGQVQITNHRWYHPDLSAVVLPTDLPDWATKAVWVDGPSRNRAGGLLVMVGPDPNPIKVVRHRNVLHEDYFKPDGPSGSGVADLRDPMHKRGWTCFTVQGEVHGHPVRGRGRVPFVYATAGSHGPYFVLQVQDGPELMDTGTQASLRRGPSAAPQVFKGGTLFEGLGRPWMGLHTIDSLRRDAGRRNMASAIEPGASPSHAKVTIRQGRVSLAYDVDLDADLVERIDLIQDSTSVGYLAFEYPQQAPATSETPVSQDLGYGTAAGGLSQWWLVGLTDGGLGR